MINKISCTFGKRLEYLMEISGINISIKGANIKLARKMMEKGHLNFYVNDPQKSLDSARSQIEKHREVESAADISGKWLKAYCDYFQCSADYLFGKIDFPTHSDTDIEKETCLSYKSIKILKDTYFKKIFAPGLDKLLQMQAFRNFLFYIQKYSDTLDALNKASKDFHTEMNRLYPNISDKGATNYLGESAIEKKYHDLEKEKEIQQFKIDLYCKEIINFINNEKTPDVD